MIVDIRQFDRHLESGQGFRGGAPATLWHHLAMTFRAFVPAAALLATLLAASPAGAVPDGGYRPLSASEKSALVNNKAYIPSGLGLTDSYVQDFPPQGLEVLLCYDAAFKPLMLPKAPGAWLAAQGNGGVGMGVYLYEYSDAKAAKSAGSALMKTKCAAKGDDPKVGLQQSQRSLPTKSGSRGILITTTMKDDGELETEVQAVRQVGLAVLKAGAVVNGGPDSPLVKKASAAVVKTVDQFTADYVKAAKR